MAGQDHNAAAADSFAPGPVGTVLSLSAAVLSGIGTIWIAALMLFAANPFVQLPSAAADGRGLNPLLQDPYMIAHPPLLFVGYAGYTIPWAMLMAALGWSQ